MNNKDQVNALVSQWIEQGLSKSEIVVNAAKAEVGWPYVWGATGQNCTVSNRKAMINRESDAEAEQTRKKCQVLNGSKSSCEGCKYYPNGVCTLIDDCQGFVKQICKRVGITFKGGGCTSMWNDNSNWTEKGSIKNLPEKVCCVFWSNGSKKSHIGFYIGNGMMVHCSGEVKLEPLSKKCTDYALIKGLDGDTPVPTFPTLKRGSKGEYVTLLQTKLIQQGYSVGSTGADGAYGAKTEAAVKQYQRDHGLKDDGICGPKTWEVLNSGVTTLYTVTIQHVSQSVAEEIIKKYGGTMVKEGE